MFHHYAQDQQCLVQLFSRVGIPDEILKDQWTNFTSRLMKLLHRQLGITAIKTSPYHPQTDGLVERFNQTLKNMLRKFVSDTGRDSDKWLPFLLFAYREVPQASTGFSPFELLYGWWVQGPLDLLRKSWEAASSNETAKSEKGIVQYVLRATGSWPKRTSDRPNKLKRNGMTSPPEPESCSLDKRYCYCFLPQRTNCL